jgi:hypothetical protein
MSTGDAEYYRAVLLGVVIGVTGSALVYMLGVAVDVKEPEEQQQRFEVVDTYKGCDVVKWNGNGQYREYKFFLDCTEQMMRAMPHGGTSIKERNKQ